MFGSVEAFIGPLSGIKVHMSRVGLLGRPDPAATSWCLLGPHVDAGFRSPKRYSLLKYLRPTSLGKSVCVESSRFGSVPSPASASSLASAPFIGGFRPVPVIFGDPKE